MKSTHLSNFQKQQYTAYLESHLQKFSVFMLSQRKQNGKYRFLEQTVARNSELIGQLQSQIQNMDHYQGQILRNQEKLFGKCQKQQDLEIRLRRLEDRQQFDCDREANKKYSKQLLTQRQIANNDKNIELHIGELGKRLRVVEEKILRQRGDGHSSKIHNFNETEVFSIVEEHTGAKIKKVEKKMKKFFAQKFEDIEALIKRFKKRKSKSPVAITPLQMCSSQFEVNSSEIPLSQFKLADNSINKSDLSTVLRDSKNTTISNRQKIVSEYLPEKKSRKRKDNENESQSKSKSKKKSDKKSDSKSKGKMKDKNGRSRSKSKNTNKSQSRSIMIDHSYDFSNLSDKSYSKDSNIFRSKKVSNQKPKKGKRSVSKSKSGCSSISLYDKCKRRPQIQKMCPHPKTEKETKMRAKRPQKHHG